MWKSSANVAAVEALVYAVIVLAAMVHAGQGSGVWLAFMPFAWLALAARLWVGLWIAAAFSDSEGWRFVVAAGMIGLLSSLFISLLFGAHAASWSGYAIVPPSALAHVAAALLAARATAKADRLERRNGASS